MSRYSQKLKDACAFCKPEQDFRRHNYINELACVAGASFGGPKEKNTVNSENKPIHL